MPDESLGGLPVAILVASDRAAEGTRPDRTGPALAEAIGDRGGTVTAIRVVADTRDAIAREIRTLAAGARVVLTAGGTGLTARDVTPEATRDVIEREIPGLAEAIRQVPFTGFPRAALSRGVAGTLGTTLVINLPGSPSGAVESFGIVAPVLAHAADLLAGRTAHADGVNPI